jgi:hypothetical protein
VFEIPVQKNTEENTDRDKIDTNKKVPVKINLKEVDVKTLLQSMIKRRQFKYTPKLIAEYFLKFIWCRNLKKGREQSLISPHYLFEKCEEKLNHELDIMHLMKQSRATQLLQQVILS